MSALFVGWDMGAWNSDENPRSRDALFAFARNEEGELVQVGRRGGYRPVPKRPFREDLQQAKSPGFLLELLEIENSSESVVVAIDAPLGWPEAFVSLLRGELGALSVPRSADQNPLAFRAIDRKLATAGVTPLSALRDMIGSQSSKALYFLRKFGFAQEEPGVWTLDGWTVVETYPALVQRSSTALKFVTETLEATLPPGLAKRQPHVFADKRDAAYCALVAALYSTRRGELVAPPVGLSSTITIEGWIWFPVDTGIRVKL